MGVVTPATTGYARLLDGDLFTADNSGNSCDKLFFLDLINMSSHGLMLKYNGKYKLHDDLTFDSTENYVTRLLPDGFKFSGGWSYHNTGIF